jgi:hypothetical protein
MKLNSFILYLSLLSMSLFNELNAQLTSIGFQYQKPFSRTPENLFGGEISRANCRYDAALGFVAGKQAQNQWNKITGRVDYHLFSWHHGYLSSRLAPYAGVQYESRSTGNGRNAAFRPRAGIKLSYDYFILDCSYMPGDGSGTLNVRFAYVVKVGNKCASKRIGEIKPFNFLRF